VTAKVAELVARGETSIPATNELFGDPTPNVVKRLRVEYLLDGKPAQKSAAENEVLELAAAAEEVARPSLELARSAAGELELKPWQPGEYQLRTARGRTARITITEPPASLELQGAWDLRFPPGWGAPEQARFDRLLSWPEHPEAGIRYFSGTAEYAKEFDLPSQMVGSGRTVMLDLGRVKNFAQAQLNGRDLPVLWKAPFRLDVTGLVRPGRNRLSVRVTNLWPNRLIGDEQLPSDIEWRGNAIAKWPQWLLEGGARSRVPEGTRRYTFTTWRFYRKDSPLLESGLVGPVVLRSVKLVGLR
jgi:hypothetical protein